MPRPGTVNNKAGSNGLHHGSPGMVGYREDPQGTVQRLTQSTQAAPLAGHGAAAHALDTARRSQRAATRPARAAAPEPTLMVAPPQDQIQPQAIAAQTWAQLAADPSIAQYPLLAEYAQRALGGPSA